MSFNLQDFRDAVKGELGGEVYELIRESDVDRWTNDGLDRLGVLEKKTQTVSWAAGDAAIVLPDGLKEMYALEPIGSSHIDSYDEWGPQLIFTDTDGASGAGSARLRYLGYPTPLAGAAATTLPRLGNIALVSYNLYRFFKALASRRADFKLYATLTGSNGVDLPELDALSERHWTDFVDARDEMRETFPAFFYED